MRFPLVVALRYLFSKKKHSAINIVSGVCAAGVCVGTVALVCVLSVYNGFQELIGSMLSNLDPEIKVSLKRGKVFDKDEEKIARMRTLDFVANSACVLEERAMLRSEGLQTTVTVKGVDESYPAMVDTKKIVKDGVFALKTDKGSAGVLGVGLAGRMGVNLYLGQPLTLYAPRHDAKISLSNPESAFNEQDIRPVGVYSVEQEEADTKYLFVDIGTARALFGYDKSQASSIELALRRGTDIGDAKKAIKKGLGDDFLVQDKKEQHEDFYKMLRVEKWITFLILAFILMIAVVNTIGSLTMLIIEKKHDMEIMRSMGARAEQIRHIFLFEGWMISLIGTLAGVVIGLTLCLLQSEFGLIKLGDGNNPQAYVVNAYPVSVEPTDILVVVLTVSVLGLMAAWFPTHYIGTGKTEKTED